MREFSFITQRYQSGRPRKSWTVTYWGSSGRVTIHNNRTQRSKTGVVDDFGNVVDADSWMASRYRWDHENYELDNIYRD